jgi:exodeoxyribonuclease VII small subunit
MPGSVAERRSTVSEQEKEQLSFEEAMQKLEEIVGRLENGDVPLETAIELFQEGMTLSRLCGSKLEQVESRIQMLVDNGQGLQKKPFAQANDDKGE